MSMHVDTRKLHFIEELLKVDNVDIIEKLESILHLERAKFLEKEMSVPMDLKAFNTMIDKSEDDFDAGKVTSAEELKKKIRKWK